MAKDPPWSFRLWTCASIVPCNVNILLDKNLLICQIKNQSVPTCYQGPRQMGQVFGGNIQRQAMWQRIRTISLTPKYLRLEVCGPLVWLISGKVVSCSWLCATTTDCEVEGGGLDTAWFWYQLFCKLHGEGLWTVFVYDKNTWKGWQSPGKNKPNRPKPPKLSWFVSGK